MSELSIQQGRLWALRSSPEGPTFTVAATGMQPLFRSRKEADAFKKRVDQIDPEHPTNTEVVEVEIIKKGGEPWRSLLERSMRKQLISWPNMLAD